MIIFFLISLFFFPRAGRWLTTWFPPCLMVYLMTSFLSRTCESCTLFAHAHENFQLTRQENCQVLGLQLHQGALWRHHQQTAVVSYGVYRGQPPPMQCTKPSVKIPIHVQPAYQPVWTSYPIANLSTGTSGHIYTMGIFPYSYCPYLVFWGRLQHASLPTAPSSYLQRACWHAAPTAMLRHALLCCLQTKASVSWEQASLKECQHCCTCESLVGIPNLNLKAKVAIVT
jgi:hypothetical protein